jgi:hypothetical protein
VVERIREVKAIADDRVRHLASARKGGKVLF